MKRALLAAILAATILPAAAQTTKSERCASMHDLTVTIAQARDRGVTLQQAHGIIGKNFSDDKQAHALMRDLVDAIYSTPEATPVQIGGNFLKGCLRGSKGGV